MTEIEKRLRELIKHTTPGLWYVTGFTVDNGAGQPRDITCVVSEEDVWICEFTQEDCEWDSAFVVECKAHVPAMLAEMDALHQRIERLETVLRDAEQRLGSEYMLNDPRPLLARIREALEGK